MKGLAVEAGGAEERLRALFDGASQYVSLLTVEGEILEVNPAALSFCGVGPSELLGRRIEDTPWWSDHPLKRERVLRAVRSAASGQPVRYEVDMTGVDGRPVTLDFSLSPARDARGCVRYLVAEGRDITEKLESRRRLESALARYRAVLASTMDPIVTIDAAGVIQAVSDSVQRVLGYRPDELVGTNVAVLMPEPHRSNHGRYLRRYADTGESTILGWPREFAALRRDGTRFPMEISVARVDMPEGGSPMFTAIIRDVSERKRAEEEIGLLQSLSLSIGEAASLPDALTAALRTICERTGWDYAEAWLSRPGSGVLYGAMNWMADGAGLERFAAAMTDLCVLPGQGLPGRVWASGEPLWMPDVSDTTEEVFQRRELALKSGLRAVAGVPILKGRETEAVLLFYVRRPRPEEGRLLDLVRAAVAPLGYAVERKRAQDAILESERRFREVVDRVDLLGVVLDLRGRVSFANECLLQHTGWSRAEIEDADWFDRLCPPELREELRRRFRLDVERGETAPRAESEIVTREGHRLLISWSVALIRDLAGDPVGVTALGVDVTEQRAIQRELEEHRLHLERLVRDRTRELEATHEQLRVADRLVGLGTLAAGLGHDMNNVLLALRCRVDAIDGEDLPDRVRRHIEPVRQSAEYLQRLSDGLHMLALDPEHEPSDPGACDLRSWWGTVGTLLMNTLPPDARLEADFQDDVPSPRVAPHALTQAVLNLVVNAAEAAGSGARIRVWASRTEDSRVVRVGVTDNGPGMSEEVRRRAFDPFFTTKSSGMGTGLGLPLVHSVATRAGGTATIDSVPSRGTTVTMDLPAAGRGAGRSDAAPSARLTIGDERTRGYLHAIAEVCGLRVGSGQRDGDDVWIVEAPLATAEHVGAFLAADARRSVVLLGDSAPCELDLARVARVEDPWDTDAIREALGTAARLAAGDEP